MSDRTVHRTLEDIFLLRLPNQSQLKLSGLALGRCKSSIVVAAESMGKRQVLGMAFCTLKVVAPRTAGDEVTKRIGWPERVSAY